MFKRKEILRIGVRDLLREASVEEILTELSDLAEVLIQKAYEICDRALRERYGRPSYRDRSGKQVRIGFTIIAMGKLGGGELNFSSDVDLLYLYETRAGKTTGIRSDAESRIANADYFRRLAQQVTAALNTATGQGYVYRVDLRLRPEGEKGLIVQPLQGYRRYYATRGETWERLSLLKAWPVGGDRSLGREFLKRVIPFLYGKPFGLPGLQEVGALKARIDEKDRPLEADRKPCQARPGRDSRDRIYRSGIADLLRGKTPRDPGAKHPEGDREVIPIRISLPKEDARHAEGGLSLLKGCGEQASDRERFPNPPSSDRSEGGPGLRPSARLPG
ncbi:MAG: hypothetical protein MPW15_09985 [Candidatus Manganitrophus sp.]|nr:hypothetical protein [Candidatus Manganitrophus sp.]